jgi:DNA invertase Pin-like site-specific DNA recombinase
MKAAATYARVRTNGQTTNNQVRELRKVARRHGWKISAEYIGHVISDAKVCDKRPEQDKLLKAANRSDFSIIMAWSVDRLGRSLQHLVGFLDEIHAMGVDLYLHQQNIDTSTPSGKAIFRMAGVIAEFERSMIQDRVRAGLEYAGGQARS